MWARNGPVDRWRRRERVVADARGTHASAWASARDAGREPHREGQQGAPTGAGGCPGVGRDGRPGDGTDVGACGEAGAAGAVATEPVPGSVPESQPARRSPRRCRRPWGSRCRAPCRATSPGPGWRICRRPWPPWRLIGRRFAAAERFAQPAGNGRLYRRRCGLDEFALFIQPGENFLAGDTEFLGQLVYAGLTCHYISCLRGDSRGPRLGFSYDALSSGLHGVLMFFATCPVAGDIGRTEKLDVLDHRGCVR